MSAQSIREAILQMFISDEIYWKGEIGKSLYAGGYDIRDGFYKVLKITDPLNHIPLENRIFDVLQKLVEEGVLIRVARPYFDLPHYSMVRKP